MNGIEKRFRVVKEYQTPYPDSIPFRQDEEVEIKREFTEDPDWKDWIWCEGANNNSGWVPRQYVKQSGARGVLLKNYDAKELTVQPGVVLVVHEILNGFGMSRDPDGNMGWVPMKVMEEA